VNRGEIRWYQFAKPDKKRPVLVLTRGPALEFLGEVTVAPITRTVREIPSEVVLDAADGVPGRCAINLDHVQTVTRAKLGRRLSELPAARWPEVEAALLFALGFSH